MKRSFKKKAMAMGMAAVMSVTSGVVLDTTGIQAAVKNLKKAEATKTMVVGVGYKKKISVTSIPKKTKITYATKNKKVATVDKKGNVKGKKTGSTVVTVKLTYNKKTTTKKCKITVKKAVKSLKVAKKTVSIKVGGTYQTKATISPAKSYQKVTYTSANKKIATVSAKGLIKGKKAGTTQITVKAQDGSKKSVKFTVKVTKSTTPTNTPVTTPTNEPLKTPGITVTNTPVITPTVAPTEQPTQTPAATESVTPTTAPTDAPTVPTQVTKTITGADVKDGKVSVEGEYDNLVIESSVGNAEITLDKVVVKNDLVMNADADYTVIGKDAQITNVKVIDNSAVVKPQGSSAYHKLAVGKRPTLRMTGTTVIVNIQIAADVQLTGEDSGKVENVTIAKESNVAIAAPITSLKVEAAAQKANVVISSLVSKLEVAASSAVVNVSVTANIQTIAVATEARGVQVTVQGQVGTLETKAKETVVKIEKEAKVTGLQVAEEAEATKVILAGEVSSVKTEAKATEVTVETSAKVTTVETSGEATKIQGSGTVENVEIKGNNTVVEGIGAGKLVVSEETTGTAVNNQTVQGGTEISLTPTGGGSSSGGDPSSSNPPSSNPPSSNPPTGGGSTGGGSGGTYVPTPAPSTPAPTPTVTPATKTFEYKKDATNDPIFKVTYNDGKVEFYTLDIESLKAYYNDQTKNTIAYKVTSYSNAAGEGKTERVESGTATIENEKLASATITVNGFKCDAKVKNITNRTCDVTVSTTKTDVEKIEFVTNAVAQKYTRGQGNSGKTVTLTVNGVTYSVPVNELLKIDTAAIGATVSIFYNKSDETTSLEAKYTKTSETKGSFDLVDGNVTIATCEVFLGSQSDAYIVVSSKNEYSTFELKLN